MQVTVNINLKKFFFSFNISSKGIFKVIRVIFNANKFRNIPFFSA